MAQQQVTNIVVREAAWENASVPVHDVVLAAWSLYRLPDIATGMRQDPRSSLQTPARP